MKKITFTFALLLILSASNVYGQATKQLNFGLIGVAYDIPVATDIAVSPFAGTNFNLDYLIIGVKGNYYFDNLLALPAAWDVYGGANAGYGFGIDNSNNSDFDMGLQIGGRWFWNDKWGLYLEFGGGHTSGATSGLGITMKL